MLLHRAMTVRVAFAAIAQSSIHRVSTNLGGVHLEPGPERIHQLRVAVPRLRAVFSAFRTVIPRRDRLRLGSELRWLQGEFGPARDWDVLINGTLGAAAKCFEGEEASHPLFDIAERRRRAANVRSEAALKGQRSRALMLGLAAWIEGPPWSTPSQAHDASDPLDLPIGKLAARELLTCHKKVFRLGAKIDGLDTERLHDLRIRVKKLRYATEFFHGLWPDGAAETDVETLKHLQASLGSVHDALVGAGLIDELASRRVNAP